MFFFSLPHINMLSLHLNCFVGMLQCSFVFCLFVGWFLVWKKKKKRENTGAERPEQTV